MLELRGYQKDIKTKILSYWSSSPTSNVLAVLPTGAGKTVIFCNILQELNESAIVIAHRRELVTQASITLARNGLAHNIIGPDSIIRQAVKTHVRLFGKSYYNQLSHVSVASVDTLVKRPANHDVKLWVLDEAHHLLKKNKWGRAVGLFPNARGLGVTATPVRADKKGLGRNSDGLFDHLIAGPTLRDLINRGALTDYKIFAPITSDLDLSQVKVSASGDYEKKSLTATIEKSKITGDIVEAYKKIALGKLAVVFAVSVSHAEEVRDTFRSCDVVAECLSANTPIDVRMRTLELFAKREIEVIINVDLFGEGFDLPAIECVIMARPTKSYALFAQQFGRALRLLEGKEHALIIDHVGNIIDANGFVNHGLPDYRSNWSLEAPKKRSSTSVKSTLKFCPYCIFANPLRAVICGNCGAELKAETPDSIEQVEGDLSELPEELLAKLREQIIDLSVTEESERARFERAGIPKAGVFANLKRFRETQEAQKELREAMSLWAGFQVRHCGLTISQAHRKFFQDFGLDVLSAQALKACEAEKLLHKLKL